MIIEDISHNSTCYNIKWSLNSLHLTGLSLQPEEKKRLGWTATFLSPNFFNKFYEHENTPNYSLDFDLCILQNVTFEKVALVITMGQ